MSRNNIFRYIVFPLTIVIAWLCVVLYTFNSKPDLNGDNFNYYIYATSLAGGNGYCDLSSPGSPATSNFPPGYPILMTPLRAVTDSIVAQKWLNEVFVLASILLLYFALLVLSLPMDIAFTASIAGLFCPRLLHFSTMMMSESSFLFMSMLVFFALILMSKKEEKWWSELTSPWFYVMLVALIFTYHIRTQGVALVAAVALVLLVRRRWAALPATIVGFVLGCLPWMLRNRALGLNGNRYLDSIMVANPWRPEMGSLGFGEVVSRFFDTLRMLIFNAFPSTILPFAKLNCLTWLLQRKWKEKRFPAYILLLLLFFSKAGLQEEHQLAQQKYPVNYRQFFAIGKSLKKNTPEGTVICSRKPQMLYMYAERPGVNYLYTEDARALIADLVKKNVDLVLVDALGYSSTYRYLIPAIQQYPQFFPRALAYYENTGTYLFTFDKARAIKELSLEEN